MQQLCKRAALAALAAMAVAGAASPALAESMYTTDGVMAVPVSFSDLDINHEAGAKALVYRVRRAAKGICGPDVSDGIAERALYSKCVNEIVQRSVAKLDNPLVTAMANGDSHGNRTTLAANGR